jgi:N-acetylmuramoyl-L-alanine amidase
MSVSRLLVVALVVVLAVAGCSDDPSTVASSTTTTGKTTSTTVATTTTVPPTTATTQPPVPWAPVPTSGDAKALVTPTGVVVPVLGRNGDAWVVRTPCAGEQTVSGGTPLYGANVVIDPGHGGTREPGAAGPTGLREVDVNFDVAQRLQKALEAKGARVVLTRTADYEETLATRAEIATKLQPQVFVSIHHNAEPDEPRSAPGTETYYQIASTQSKRLAGIIYREVTAALSAYHIGWVGDRDAGAKYRPGKDGGDYYGILRRTAGIPAMLAELAFITNPPEEKLLATPAFRQVEADAVARGIVEFISNPNDPGAGFVTPYPRTEPAGGGGGAGGCVPTPLG